MGDGGLWRRQDPKKRVKAGSLKAQLAIMATSMIGEGNPYGQVHVTLQFQAFEPPAAAGRPPIPVAIEFCTHSKGEFSPEMQLELSSLGSMLLMREVAEGPVVRAAFLPGGKVGKSKGKRSGHPMILRLDLPEGGDSLADALVPTSRFSAFGHRRLRDRARLPDIFEQRVHPPFAERPTLAGRQEPVNHVVWRVSRGVSP